jgi:diguanylate cyclase (GGDEF)-like protein
LSSWERITSKHLRTLRLDRVRNKILAFSVLATLIPSLSTGWLAYTQGRRALTEKISNELIGVSSRAANEVDLWLKEQLFDLRVFSSSYEVTENLQRLGRARGASPAAYAKERLRDYLNSVQERYAGYRQLVVFDMQGRPVARSPDKAAEFRLPSSWEAEARSGSPVLGTPAWDAEGKRLVLVVALPVQPPGGRLLGMLAGRLDLADVHEILRRAAMGRRGKAILVTAGGALIASSESPVPSQVTGSLPRGALKELSEESHPVAGYDDREGVPVLATAQPVSLSGWHAVAELPRMEGYGQIIRLRNVTGALLAGLFVFVGLLAYVLGLLLVRPIERLASGAKEVADGNFDVKLPVLTGGELGYLTEGFNKMVERLREGRQKLDETNEELRQTNAQLENLSRTDPLTGLFNRRHLMATLDDEIRRSSRSNRAFSILMIDVDHFKTYNDAFGHQAGDEALRKVAAVLRATLREVDCPARYGGEEFLALLPETGIVQAVEVSERVRDLLAKEQLKGRSVTVSIGVAEFPAHGGSLESLIASADAALYRAKRQGRDHVVRADWSHLPAKDKVRA